MEATIMENRMEQNMGIAFKPVLHAVGFVSGFTVRYTVYRVPCSYWGGHMW